MNFSRMFRSMLVGLVAGLAAWSPAVASAQTAGAESDKSYVGPYFLVVMLIAFGLIIVCKSARRRDEVKPIEQPAGPSE
ncbi:MAG: hypothetical protein WD403_09880 [Pirellulales bacterium]